MNRNKQFASPVSAFKMKIRETFYELLEARDAVGKVWRVVIIKAGTSKNKLIYPAETLKKALHFFENALAYTFELARKQDYDHIPDSIKNLKNKFVRNLVGWFTNVKYEKYSTPSGNEEEGVTADFHIPESANWLRELLRSAWREGQKSLLGFSIDGSGNIVPKPGSTLGIVEEIDGISSVDVVARPAAGGKLLRLVASVGDTRGGETDTMDFIKWLLETVKKDHPDLVESLDAENISDDQLITLFGKLNESLESMLKEGLKEECYPMLSAIVAKLITLVKGDKKDEALKILQDMQAKIEKYPAPQASKEEKPEEKKPEEKSEEKKPEGGDSSAATEAAKQAEASAKNAKELEEKAQMREAKALLLEKLAESDLPEPVKAKVRKSFEGRIFESKELEESIKDEKDTLAKLSETGQVQGLGRGRVQITESEKEKLNKAMDGMFEDGDVDGVPRFRSLREAFQKMTGTHDAAAQDVIRACYGQPLNELAGARLTEAITTSTFAQALGDSITRKMIKEYKLPALNDWRKIVSDIVPIKDFRTNRRALVGGYGALPGVAESGTYTALTSPGDDENTYAVSKKGGTEDITLETVANDDMGVVKRIPKKLGRAGVLTLSQAVFDLIADNTATAYDGTVIFHATHNNLGSTALSAAEMSVIRAAMVEQIAYGSTTEVLGASNVPKYILVPAELEELAFKIAKSLVYVIATNENATTPNLHAGLEGILVPHWTDANDYAVVADPNNVPTIEVGFLNGREEPELFVQDLPNVGTVFSADKITYKIRHIWGLCVLDYRGMYKAAVV